MARQKGPTRMRKFIIIFILRLGASCLPVISKRICARSRAMISALTHTSYMNAQNLMNVAILLVTLNISSEF